MDFSRISQGEHKPTLVLMAGLSGAGKTALALRLGAALQWPVLSKDTLRSSLLMMEIIERVAGFAAYEVLFALVYDMLVKQNISVIVDCSTLYPFILHRSLELTRMAGARLKVVHCMADSHVRSDRLMMRETVTAPTFSKPALLTKDEEHKLFAHLPHNTLVIHTVGPLEEYLPKVIAYVACEH